MGDENNEILEPLEAVEEIQEGPGGELTEVFKETLLDEAPLSAPLAEDELTELDRLPDPNENPNPILAVEEMLDAATMNDVLAEITPAVGEVPSFQIHLSLKKAQAEIFQKIAAEHGIDANAQIISHLTEYQAVRLAMDLRKHQIGFLAQLYRPESLNSEEDMALGSLLTVADPSSALNESAPEVILPKNEKGVLLFTGNEIPGFMLVQTLGIVTAHRSLARRFFRGEELQEQMNREMAKLGNPSIPKSKLESLLREIFLDLQKNALSQGGNSVLATRIEAFPETNHLDPGLEQMRLVALGTAAVVEKLTV